MDNLNRTRAACLEAGLHDQSVLVTKADVVDWKDIEEIVNKTVAHFHQIDILVGDIYQRLL